MQNPSDVLFAHIHRAPTGMNGPIIATFFDQVGGADGGPDYTGTVTLGPSDVDPLRAGGGLYADVHTGTYTAGEIRGWLARE